MTAALATRACLQCGEAFPLRASAMHQLFCGERCRWRYRDRTDPQKIALNRIRNARWCAANRNVTNQNPWLRGAPPCGPYLPGGGTELWISPPPRWPIELRNTRALHGMLTQLSGAEHDPHLPRFALVPLPSNRWGVYWHDADVAVRLANRPHEAVLYDRPVTVTCGPLVRAKAPQIERRGRRRLRIDAITPVCVRHDGGTGTHLLPTGANLASTIATWLPQRIGITLRDDQDVQLRILERKTQPQWVSLGDKYGNVAGWVGHLIIEANAVTCWLLRAAETIGLGGRVAFGLGRIRVSESAC